MLFFCILLYGLWSCHSFLIRNELEVFGIQVQSLMTIQQRWYVLFVITTVEVVWKCLVPTIIFVVISAVLILSHAFLRDPKHIETMDLLGDNESGGGGGGESDDDEEVVHVSDHELSSGSEVMVESSPLVRRGGGGSGDVI